MSVHINIPQFLQHLAGNTVVFDARGSTVGECLAELITNFPQLKGWIFSENGELKGQLNIFVDGQSAYPEGLTKPVKNGDNLHIVYLVVGG